ncbi:unnamed protein product [Acanthoscelides obtectus]|uniref:Uncharacterized protein n=1 Tax=Acanthoscelides obtectus TaxID=200917 RepID=A0A9P0JN72_ACAOB|nr:unnamed protein product [Acanthoscelides obtectus]CAK1624916.1 hypothetical protein AOBTE_LOCUS2851 [Acanthoscelides obtectus]
MNASVESPVTVFRVLHVPSGSVNREEPVKEDLRKVVILGQANGAALISSSNDKQLENLKGSNKTNQTSINDDYYDYDSVSQEMKESKKQTQAGTSEEIPAPEPLVLPGYNLPENIFNKGKPFYIEKDPETGKIDFSKKSSESTSKFYDDHDYYDDEVMEASESVKHIAKIDGSALEDNKGTANNNIYDKNNIDRKDGYIDNSYSSHKHSNDINQLTTNFHDFLNLPVKYNPQKYVYPLISSSYASTKIQGSVNKLHNHKDFDRYNDKNYSYNSGTKGTDKFVQTTSVGSNNIGSDYFNNNANKDVYNGNTNKVVTTSSTTTKYEKDYADYENEGMDYSYNSQGMDKGNELEKGENKKKGMGNHPDFGDDFDYYDDYTTNQASKASSTTQKTNINDLYLTTKSPKTEATTTMKTTMKLNVFSITTTKRPLSLFEQLFGDYDETVAPVTSSSTSSTPVSTTISTTTTTKMPSTSTSTKISYSESSDSQKNGHANPSSPIDQNYDYMDEYNDKYEHEDNLAVPSDNVIKKQEHEEDDLKIEPLDGNNQVNTHNTKYHVDLGHSEDHREENSPKYDDANQKHDGIKDKVDDTRKIVTSMPIDTKDDDDTYNGNRHQYTESPKVEITSTVVSISTPSTVPTVKVTSMPLGDNHVTSGSSNPGMHINKDPIIVATQNLKEKLNGEKVMPKPFDKGHLPPSVSNIHIPPNQDSVSFVMGNHQKVGDGSQHLQGETSSSNAGGQYVGTSLKESPYDSNPFKPYFSSGGHQNGQYMPQKTKLTFAPTAVENDFNHQHQHGFSAITIQPLRNSEASLAIGVPINSMKQKPVENSTPLNQSLYNKTETDSYSKVPNESSSSMSQYGEPNGPKPVEKTPNTDQHSSLNGLNSYLTPSSASEVPLGSNTFKNTQTGGFDSYQKPPSINSEGMGPLEALRPPPGSLPPSPYGSTRPHSPGLGAYHTNRVGPVDQKLHTLDNREVLKLNSRPMYHQLANDLMSSPADGEDILRPPPRPDLRPVGRPPYDPRPGHFHTGKIEYNRPPRPQLDMSYKRIDNLPNILPQFRPNALGGKPANNLGPNLPLGHGKYPISNPNSRIGVSGTYPALDRPSGPGLLYYEKKPFIRQPLLERPASNRPIGFYEKMHPHPGHRNQGKGSYPIRKNIVYTSNINNNKDNAHQPDAEERILNKNVDDKSIGVTIEPQIGIAPTPPQPKIVGSRHSDDETEIETLQMIQAKKSEKTKHNQDNNTEDNKKNDKQLVKIDSDGQVVTISAKEVDENSNLNDYNNEEDKQKDKTIYKVYPINSGPVMMDGLGIHNKQTPVVVGSLSEIPLPPSKISADQDSLGGNPSLLFDIKNRNDDPILQPQMKPASYGVKNDFPYRLERPDMSLSQHDSISVPNQSNNDLEEGYTGNGGYTILPSNQISATLKTYTERPIAIAYTPTESPGSHQQGVQHFVNEYMPVDHHDKSPQNEKEKNEFTVTAVIHTHPQYNQGVKPGQQYPYINHRPPTHGQVADMINHRIDSDVDPDIPKLGFEAPFVASSNIENTHNNGWTVISKEPQKNTTNGESKDSSSVTTMSYASSSEFDIENFKPQLEGGFKPIYSLTKEDGESRESINERSE